MGINYNPQIVTDGLIFYCDAKNTKSYSGTGSIWYDLSSNRANATFVQDYNNLAVTLNNPTYDGNSIAFINNQSAYVDDTLTRINGANFTYDYIFYYDNTFKQNLLMNKRKTASPYNQISIAQSQDAYVGGAGKKIHVFIRPDNSDGYGNVPDRVLTYDLAAINRQAGIIHLTVVNDSTSARLYIDGNLVVTNNSVQTNSTFNITGFNTFIGINIKTYIVRIYNRALTAQEVSQNFNAIRGRYGI